MARYNGLPNPSQVKAGQNIRVPATENALAARADALAPDAPPAPAPELDVAVTVAPEIEPAPPAPAAPVLSLAELKLADSEKAEQAGDVISAYALAAEAAELEPDSAATSQRLASLRPAAVDAHYRAAISAFSSQDLEGTLMHTDMVLALDPEHTNAQVYRVRAEELKVRLDALNQE